uniref:Storkhead-box protein 1 n=1 Tax=Cynoglossus semilaevis TaxID=244447 RepID=A0A3P8UME8_CYNSE
MDKSLQIAPHSLALVLSHISTDEDGEDSQSSSSLTAVTPRAVLSVNFEQQHNVGYEVFANFKAVNMQHFWDKSLTRALSEIFFLGWIDEHVLLIQGKEVHLQVLRNGWTRRALTPPQGFHIKCIAQTEQVDPRTYSKISPRRPPYFQCPISLISTLTPPPLSRSLLPHQSGYVMCLPTHANGDATNGSWD